MAIFKYDSVMPVLSKGGSGVKAPSLVAVVNGVQAPIPNVVAGYPTPTDAGVLTLVPAYPPLILMSLTPYLRRAPQQLPLLSLQT